MLKVTHSQLQCYGVAILSTTAALLLTILLGMQSQPNQSALFFAAVTFSAWYGGARAGLLASVLATLAINYYFKPAFNSFSIGSWGDVLQLAVFGSVVWMISSLNAELRAAKQRMEASLYELKVSEERYGRLVDTAGVGIWSVNGELRTEYANQRLAQMLGYEPQEMLDRSIFEFMDSAARLEAEQRIKRGMRGIKQPFDFRYRCKDGSQFWAIVSMSEILNEKGEFIGAIAQLTDITERKQTEETLRKANKRFQLAASVVNNIIYDWDIENHTVERTKGLTEILGYAPEEIEPSSDWWGNLIHPDDRQRAYDGVLKALESQDNYSIEYRVLHKNNQYIHVWDRGLIVRAADGRGDRAIGSILDISDSKQAEEKLWETNQTLNSLIQSCPLGITVFGIEDGNVTMWNPAAERIFGWSEAEVIGRFLPSVSEDKKQDFLANLEAIRQGKTIAGKEICRQRKDGSSIALAVWACALRDAKGDSQSCMSILADISDRLQLEEELRSALTKLTFHVENSPLGVIEWDENFQVTRWSKQAEEMFGWSASEVLGKKPTDWQFIFAEDLQVVNELIERLSNGTEQRNAISNRNYTKKGKAIECEWYNSAQLDESGKMISVLSVVQDVSDRKEFLAALRESENRFRRLVKSNIIGCIFWDADGKIFDANDAFLRMVGYTREEMQAGKLNWKSMTPKEQIHLSYGAIAQMKQQGAANVLEKEYIRKDGSRIPVILGGVMFEDSQELGVSFVLDLTERKQMEEALRASEERLRLALEASGTIAWDWNLIANEIVYSANAEEVWGTGVYNGETAFAIVHPDDRKRVQEIFEEAIATGGEYLAEFRTIRADTGALQWMEDRGRAIRDESGKVTRFGGIVTDITERKRAEERSHFLSEATSILAASLDYKITLASIANLVVPTLADCCFFDIITADDRIERVAWKHADSAKWQWFEEVQNFVPPQQFNNHPVREVLLTGKAKFVPEITDDWMQAIASSAEHLQFMRELQMRSLITVPLIAQNRQLGVLTFCLAAASGRNYTSADLALAEDIAQRAALAIENSILYREATEARQKAEAAANRTALLQAVTAAFSEALTPSQVSQVVVDRGIASLGAKAGLVALLVDKNNLLKIVAAVGYPQEFVDSWDSFPVTAPVAIAEVVRTRKPRFFETLSALIAEYTHLAYMPAITGNQAFACIPLTVEGKTIGALGFSFASPREFSQEDRAFMGALGQQCAQAIARARLYEGEQRARAEAEGANRIKDEFLAVLSHELRSPLNPILGWIKLLRTRKFEADVADRALEVIERNAKLQAKLVEDLLDVSRILRGKMSLNVSPVNLVSIIEAAIETVRLASAAKSIQIQTAIARDVGSVSGDPNRLQQILWNILSNAVKFTPEGGRVEIRLSVEMGNWSSVIDTENKELSITNDSLPITNYAQIQVSDTGKGISADFLPHVFDYFRQADSSTTRIFGGLGLGLAIVRHLVEMHGGTVFAESPGEGQGSTFTVRLPLMKVVPKAIKANVLPDRFVNLEGLRLLVVDDDADTRELIAFILEQHGAQVRAVSSSTDAIAQVALELPDLLLSDIGMPEEDGYMLIRQIRALPAARGGMLPAIALTAYAGETDRQQILKAGFQKHVTKPVEPSQLVAIVARLVGRL